MVAKAYRSLTHVGHKTDQVTSSAHLPAHSDMRLDFVPQVKDAANEQNEEEKGRSRFMEERCLAWGLGGSRCWRGLSENMALVSIGKAKKLGFCLKKIVRLGIARTLVGANVLGYFSGTACSVGTVCFKILGEGDNRGPSREPERAYQIEDPASWRRRR